MKREDEIKAERLAIEAHQRRLDELLSDAWPKRGDLCWSALSPQNSQVYSEVWAEFLSLGLLNRTQANARMHHELMKVVQELRECDGFRPFVAGEYNWSFSYNAELNVIGNDSWQSSECGWEHLYYETPKQRDAALDKVGRERVLKVMQWAAGRGR